MDSFVAGDHEEQMQPLQHAARSDESTKQSDAAFWTRHRKIVVVVALATAGCATVGGFKMSRAPHVTTTRADLSSHEILLDARIPTSTAPNEELCCSSGAFDLQTCCAGMQSGVSGTTTMTDHELNGGSCSGTITCNGAEADSSSSWTCDCMSNTLSAPASAPAPDATHAEKEKQSCFPGQSTVQVLGRGRTYIANLKVGDYVLAYGSAGDMSYEPVLAFLHAMAGDSRRQLSYIEVKHDCGDFRASSNHIVFILRRGSLEDKLVGDLEIGDQLMARRMDAGSDLDSNLEPCPILRIQTMHGHQGMYAPLTPTGTILVDDVVSSTYASAQGSKFSHKLMHAIFLPVRAYYSSGLSSLLASSWASTCSRSPTLWFCQGDGRLSSKGMDEMHPLPYFFSVIMGMDKLLR